MDDDGGVERAPVVLVGVFRSAVDVLGNVSCGNACLGKEAAQGFCRKAEVICGLGIHASDECPICGFTELFCLRVGRHKSPVAIVRSRVVGGAQGDLCQYHPHCLQELIALLPFFMLNDYARGITVEACIIGEHRHNVFSLVSEVACAPGAGYDDDRADVAQLTCNAPGQYWLALRFPPGALLARVEDNSLKGLVRAGDMNFLDAWMVAEVRSFRSSTVCYA